MENGPEMKMYFLWKHGDIPAIATVRFWISVSQGNHWAELSRTLDDLPFLVVLFFYVFFCFHDFCCAFLTLASGSFIWICYG